MDIKGLVEVSFVDWDGKVASVIFLPGCNFRCPMCQNYRLITNPGELENVPLERILAFLVKRRDFIDGVVITGGEPTICADLPNFCRIIKNSGFLVKLDTNGSNPAMLKRLIDEKLIDYVAMDIKSALDPEKYRKAAGADVEIGNIMESIELLTRSGIDYEFRTTVVPSLNDVEDIRQIAKSISGARKFVLQYFRPSGSMDPKLSKTKPMAKEEMDAILRAACAHVKNTIIRGSPFV
jgi:pyruvate formate lyase activating enzyme